MRTVREKMSFVDQIYELPPGAMVEIQLKETAIRGEFNLVSRGVGRNPEVDQIHLERPMELPSGKQRNGTVSVSVKDIINCKLGLMQNTNVANEYGLNRK